MPRPRKPTGRPRKTLPANAIEIISGLASKGFTETAIAAALGMDGKTWHKLREENPKAKAAWAEARAQERDALVNVLYQAAIDKGNCVAAMFLLKSRHGFRDQGPIDGSAEGPRVGIVFNLPAALPADAYARLVQVAPQALPNPEDSR